MTAQLDQDRAALGGLVDRARRHWVDYLREHLDSAVEGVLPDAVAAAVIADMAPDVPPAFALAAAELAVRGYGLMGFAEMTDELLHLKDWLDE
jgi:hypothetical protein